jgi:hypothetical protein
MPPRAFGSPPVVTRAGLDLGFLAPHPVQRITGLTDIRHRVAAPTGKAPRTQVQQPGTPMTYWAQEPRPRAPVVAGSAINPDLLAGVLSLTVVALDGVLPAKRVRAAHLHANGAGWIAATVPAPVESVAITQVPATMPAPDFDPLQVFTVPAGPRQAQARRRPRRRRHADPASWVRRQPQRAPALPGAGRRVPVQRRWRGGVRRSRCAQRQINALPAACQARQAEALQCIRGHWVSMYPCPLRATVRTGPVVAASASPVRAVKLAQRPARRYPAQSVSAQVPSAF